MLQAVKNLEIERKKRIKHVKVIEIRKNEHFGDVLMFLNEASPLSVKVRTNKAELFFLKKMDAIEISSNYPNISKRINKKSLHNMEQIKKLMLRVLQIFCSINGYKIKDKRLLFQLKNSTINLNINNINNVIDKEDNQDKKTIIKKRQKKKQENEKKDKNKMKNKKSFKSGKELADSPNNQSDFGGRSLRKTNMKKSLLLSLSLIEKPNAFQRNSSMPSKVYESKVVENFFLNNISSSQIDSLDSKRSNSQKSSSLIEKNSNKKKNILKKEETKRKIETKEKNNLLTISSLSNETDQEGCQRINHSNTNKNILKLNQKEKSLFFLSTKKKKKLSYDNINSKSKKKNKLNSNKIKIVINQDDNNSDKNNHENNNNNNNINQFLFHEINNEIHQSEKLDIQYYLKYDYCQNLTPKSSNQGKQKLLFVKKLSNEQINNSFLRDLLSLNESKSIFKPYSFKSLNISTEISFEINSSYENINKITQFRYITDNKLRQRTKNYLMNEYNNIKFSEVKKNENDTDEFHRSHKSHHSHQTHHSVDNNRSNNHKNHFLKETSKMSKLKSENTVTKFIASDFQNSQALISTKKKNIIPKKNHLNSPLSSINILNTPSNKNSKIGLSPKRKCLKDKNNIINFSNFKESCLGLNKNGRKLSLKSDVKLLGSKCEKRKSLLNKENEEINKSFYEQIKDNDFKNSNIINNNFGGITNKRPNKLEEIHHNIISTSKNLLCPTEFYVDFFSNIIQSQTSFVNDEPDEEEEQ